jgi:metal-sulfur cluster biosynthetic enzyme/nitrite reductase/ring-hydroxylating ferredoxin subunit
MTDFTQVATLEEIPPGGRLSIVVDDLPALLVRVGDEFYAFEDVCTHDGQPLTDGPIEGREITCPRHGARFDMATGQPTRMPATEPIATFDVKVSDGAVLVRPKSDSASSESSSSSVSAPAENLPVKPESAATDRAGASEPPEKPDAATLLEALRDVVDPELMINIVDLGLIYEIDQQNEKVVVQMTLTSPACPAGPQIIQQSKMALERLRGVDEAEIRLVMSPPWTPDRMTDEARDQLGIF